MKLRIKQRILPIAMMIVIVCSTGAGVAAQPGGLPDWGSDSTAGLKAGPLGLNPVVSANEQLPVAMVIADADVDADVEVRTISDGIMQDPTGPWVVSWYDFSGLIGSLSNAVFAGHVDYWGVGPSVLRNINSLQQGAEILVTGEDGTVFTYAVESIYRIDAYNLSAEELEGIIGPTDYPALTIITCGGEFNGSEYLQRDILRARLVSSTAADSVTPTETAEPGEESASGTFETGATATVANDNVNIRTEPTTSSDVAGKANAGDVVTITGNAQEADGYVWWPIETAGGVTGWIAEDFLQP